MLSRNILYKNIVSKRMLSQNILYKTLCPRTFCPRACQPIHYVDGEGYNILSLPASPNKHYVDGEGYDIIFACKPKHQKAPQTFCEWKKL